MKKITIIMATMAITLVSCGNQVKGNGNDLADIDTFMLDGPGSVYEPTEVELGESALEAVQDVYKAVSEAYKGDDWQEKSSQLDKKFCSQDWNATVAAFLEKDRESGGLGYFEADYWVMGQDFDAEHLHASNFVLKEVNKDQFPWRAFISLTLHNFSDIPVEVELVYEDGYWKVDDLNQWKQDMKDYLSE